MASSLRVACGVIVITLALCPCRNALPVEMVGLESVQPTSPPPSSSMSMTSAKVVSTSSTTHAETTTSTTRESLAETTVRTTSLPVPTATENNLLTPDLVSAAESEDDDTTETTTVGTRINVDECKPTFTSWSPWTEKGENIKDNGCGHRRRTRKLRNATLAAICYPQGYELAEYTETCTRLSKDETRDAFQYYVIDRLFGWSTLDTPSRRSTPQRRRRQADGFTFNFLPNFGNQQQQTPHDTDFWGCPLNKAHRPIDFLIMLDKSGSLTTGQYRQLRNSMSNLLTKAVPYVSEQSTRVALMTFAELPQLEFNFNVCRNKKCCKRRLRQGTGPNPGGVTQLAFALEEAATAFAEDNGARRCSRRVILLVTDGAAKHEPASYRAAADYLKREMDVEIFVIGITKLIDESQLREIASAPVITHLYYMSTVKVVKKICRKLQHAKIPEEYLVDIKPTGSPG